MTAVAVPITFFGLGVLLGVMLEKIRRMERDLKLLEDMRKIVKDIKEIMEVISPHGD